VATVSQESSESPASQYDAIGGAASVKEAVERFYQRVVGDPQLAHYFADVDLPRLKRHQALLIGQLLGGPTDYDGRSLGDAHAGMGITGTDYALVGEHLLGTLAELQVGPQVLETIDGALASVRGDIVTAPDAGGGPGSAVE
jgi:hemoglobin